MNVDLEKGTTRSTRGSVVVVEVVVVFFVVVGLRRDKKEREKERKAACGGVMEGELKAGSQGLMIENHYLIVRPRQSRR